MIHILKKTDEQIRTQITGFLDMKKLDKKISKKTAENIKKTLLASGGFLNKLKEFIGIISTIQDKKIVEKKFKDIFTSEDEIQTFNELWEEYRKYIGKKNSYTNIGTTKFDIKKIQEIKDETNLVTKIAKEAYADLLYKYIKSKSEYSFYHEKKDIKKYLKLFYGKYLSFKEIKKLEENDIFNNRNHFCELLKTLLDNHISANDIINFKKEIGSLSGNYYNNDIATIHELLEKKTPLSDIIELTKNNVLKISYSKEKIIKKFIDKKVPIPDIIQLHKEDIFRNIVYRTEKNDALKLIEMLLGKKISSNDIVKLSKNNERWLEKPYFQETCIFLEKGFSIDQIIQIYEIMKYGNMYDYQRPDVLEMIMEKEINIDEAMFLIKLISSNRVKKSTIQELLKIKKILSQNNIENKKILETLMNKNEIKSRKTISNNSWNSDEKNIQAMNERIKKDYENIEFIINEMHIKDPDTICKMRNINPKNVTILFEKIPAIKLQQDDSEINKFIHILKDANPEVLKTFLYEFDIHKLDELNTIGNYIYSIKKPETIKILKNTFGIKIDDFTRIQRQTRTFKGIYFRNQETEELFIKNTNIVEELTKQGKFKKIDELIKTPEDGAILINALMECSSENLKTIIEILKVNELKDLEKWAMLLLQKKAENVQEIIEIMKGIKIENTNDLYEIGNALCIDDPKCWKIMIDAGITGKNEIIEIKDYLSYRKSDDLQKIIYTLKSIGIINIQDLIELRTVLGGGKNENLEILIKNGITKKDEINDRKTIDILHYADPEKIQKTIDILDSMGINKKEDIYRLRVLLGLRQTRNLEIIKEIGITGIDEIEKLQNTILMANTEILETIIRIGITKTEQIDQMSDILYSHMNSPKKVEKIKKIVKRFQDIGITKPEDLFRLHRLFLVHNEESLDIIINIGITGIKDLEDIQESIIKSDPNFLRKIINKLESLGIEKSEGIKKLKNIWETKDDKKLEKNIESISMINITDIEDIIRLEKILIKGDNEKLAKIIGKYKGIRSEQLASISEFIINSEELDMIEKKYPNITIDELIKLNSQINTTKNRKIIIQNIDFHLEDFEEGAMIIDLINDYTNQSKEIFEKIKDPQKITEENRIEITALYSAIEYFEDSDEIPEEIKTAIRNLFKQENQENKNFVYQKMREILSNTLEECEYKKNNKETALIKIINKKGLYNFPLMENLGKFIYQLQESLAEKYTFNTTKTNIKQKIKIFLQKNKNRSIEDFNEFFHISTNILNAAPSIYQKILSILLCLEPNQLKYFQNEILPFYNVELILRQKKGKHEKTDLMEVNRSIRNLLHKITRGKNKREILEEEKKSLIEKIKILFKEKFGIIKIPNPISEKNIESIRSHSLYLANMYGKTKEKEAVLGFFLALKINNKRNTFRENEKIDPNEYMETNKAELIEEYIGKRENVDVIKKYEKDTNNINLKILQETEISRILGDAESISNRLYNINHKLNDLLDEDLYEEQEKILLKHMKKNENELGKILGLKHQELSGKKQISKEQEEIINQLELDLNTKLDKDKIENIQKLMKGISPVVNFVRKIEETNLEKEIKEFERLRIPNKEIIEIFNKLGEHFSTESGVMGISEDIQYLEMKIDKDTNILNEEEKKIANEYIAKIKKELMDLYDIKEKIEELFGNFMKSTENSNNQKIKNRLKEMKDLFTFFQEGKKENIISLMTNDLDIVIKNIRQCLGCTKPECNNDTNLSFGSNNRFLITTTNKSMETSYADELVTLLPSEQGLLFVMDRVYSDKAKPDILVNNILAVIKKVKKMNNKNIGILVSNAAIGSCTLSFQSIEKKLEEEGIKDFSLKEVNKIMIDVPEDPIDDSYYEFGGITEKGEFMYSRGGVGKVYASGFLLNLN